jgi:tetratricopeptide (TPR) repeat protein
VNPSSVQALLQEGIAAAKLAQQKLVPAGANPREQARELLFRVIELDEENVSAWLWLSTVVDTQEEQQTCLENVLLLDPPNKHAQAGLARLKGGAPPVRADPQPEPASAPPPVARKYERVSPRSEETLPGPPASTAPRSKYSRLSQSPAQLAPAKKAGGVKLASGCPFCRQPLSAIDKNCPHCQLPLVMSCPACETGLDVEQPSCNQCGQAMGNYQQPLKYFAGLGLAYQEQQRAAEAVKAWQAVESLKPDYPHLYTYLGEAHLEAGRPDRAWASLQQALEREPESAELYFALGELARRRGEWEEAFQNYQEATRREPQHGRAWLRLGQLYQQVHRRPEAVQAFQKAVRLLAPGSAEQQQVQAALAQLNPGLPQGMATGWPELLRQMTGPVILCLLAALMDSGLRPWWMPVTGWLALLLAVVGAFLWVTGTDLPRNPLMQSLAGEGHLSDEVRLALAGAGAILWLLAMLLILLPLGQAYPELPTL